MTYTVTITETAQKEIRKKLEVHMIERLNKRVKKLESEPRVFGKPLRKPLAGIWEMRFEKRWRILYKIYDDKMVVEIVAFWHKDEM